MDQSFFRFKKVLVIDDCAPVRATVKGMLQQMGFEAIHVAKDATEAVHKCIDMPFDFILCDFNLGDCKDGYQLFEALKKQQLLAPLCCFIVISAESQSQIVHGVIELQPDDYLLKPFTAPALEERICRAIKNRLELRKVFFRLFENEFAEAARECDLVIRTNPDYALQAMRVKGELLLKLGEYDKAELFYQKVLKQKPYSWARLGHALSCFYLERWEDTELELVDLTQFGDTKVEALDWLSRLYVRHGRYQLAFETLSKAATLSPKNISRQKTLSNLCVVLGHTAAASRIAGKIVQGARHSIDDTADNYLNHARALVDEAKSASVLDKAVILQNAGKLLDALHKRFNVDVLKRETVILRSRMSSCRGSIKEGRELMQQIQNLSLDDLTIDSYMDAAKAYFELGDLYSSQQCIDRLRTMLYDDDFLTETQRIMLQLEQDKHESLKQQIKQINTEASDAYRQGQYGRAVSLFCETFDYMPTNPVIALNLLQAMSKSAGVTGEAIDYAKSAARVLRQNQLEKSEQERFEKYVATLKKTQPGLAQVQL